MRRVTTALIAATTLFVITVPAFGAPVTLTDLADHWAKAQVESGVSAGFIAGYPDGTFRPEQPTTRAEFYKLLAGALREQPRPGQSTTFQDTQHWVFDQGWVQTAVLNGLLYPPDYGTKLLPDAPISRREIVLAAVRALGKASLVNEKTAVLTASDAASYPAWLKGWSVLALGDGIMTGYPDGSLRLNQTATRAEALVMVQRILAKVSVDVSPYESVMHDGMARHPAAGEPNWWYTGNAQQLGTISNGSESFTFPVRTWGVYLKPAPGRGVWVNYVVDGAQFPDTVGVLGYLKGGKMTEVARFSGRSATMLAVDDTARLWYADGAKLYVVSPGGQPKQIAAVTGEITQGGFDGGGAFWGISTTGWPQVGTLWRVTAEGAASAFPMKLQNGEQVGFLGVGEDGSVWVSLKKPEPTNGTPSTWPFFTVAKYKDGTQVDKNDLMTYYQAGNDPVGMRVIGQTGPFVWMTRNNMVNAWDVVSTGLFKLDLTNGAFAQVAVSRSLSSYTPVSAPDGGILLKDDHGVFWRVIP